MSRLEIGGYRECEDEGRVLEIKAFECRRLKIDTKFDFEVFSSGSLITALRSNSGRSKSNVQKISSPKAPVPFLSQVCAPIEIH